MSRHPETVSDRNLPLILLFAATLFTSASLMFVLQPLFGKILLPLLGGSPAVWNTCMVFYQSILFLGYLYAHYLSTRHTQHRQIQIHTALILVSFLTLPLALPENAIPPTDSNPIFWLLWTLFLAIGLPFFVVSTTAPLIQKWFANVGHHTSHDPYYLYAASNTGSLIALLSYPFLLEPNIGLANQKNYWSIGYLLLCLLIAGCAFVLWKNCRGEFMRPARINSSLQDAETVTATDVSIHIRPHPSSDTSRRIEAGGLFLPVNEEVTKKDNDASASLSNSNNPPEEGGFRPAKKFDENNLSLAIQLHWLALAFVPSSLLLGLTNFISTDIASVPLLWIIPLTLYLLSFVIVFSKWNDKVHPLMVKLQPLFLLPFIAYAFINPADLPYWAYLILHLLAFFFAVMVCHGELAKLRPRTRHLTTFYLIMSFAGMLGGMFNTFVAPFVFNAVYEYPVMIIAALMLRPGRMTNLPLQQIIAPALLVIAGIIAHATVDNLLQYFDIIVIGLMGLTLLTYLLRARPVGYALMTGAIIFLSLGLHGLSSHTLYQQRSFFGVLAVREAVLTDEQGQPESYHELFHGTTKHGAQRLAAHLSQIPLTYYSRPGPMGQLFKEYDANNQAWNIGVVGLGAGALTCYAKDQQSWTLYEIDPLVVDIASNPAYFSYLSQCAPNAAMRIGDARLSLEKEPDQHFDLLVMDAFSSDSVPTHLLTKEALALYFKKLKDNGILAFHMTNRHLSLKKVLSINAEALHLASLIQEFQPQQDIPLVVATDWVVMAKHAETLEPLRLSRLGKWQKMPLYFDMKPWTDDFTNIVSIWK